MGLDRRLVAGVAALVVAVAGIRITDAQDVSTTRLETGRLIEKLSCRTDPSQTYTLYLPSAYTTDRRWPALLILDPRGRSAHAAELFRAAAETYGWILISSDNTRSDGPMEPNHRALAALWPEITQHYATDNRRLYAAGFSGGAHFSWMLGLRTGGLAGVIASGGRLIPELLEGTSFALFCAVGTTDFNYQDMKRVDDFVARQGNPHRLEIFDGTHQWMPAPLALQAVEWLELEAMKAGLREQDEALVSRLWDADLAAAGKLEEASHTVEAQRRYEAIARSFAGLHDVSHPTENAAALARTESYRSAAKEERRWDRYEDSYRDRLFGFAGELRQRATPASLGETLRELKIERLKSWASEDSYRGTTAARILATVHTQCSFYLSNEFFARGDFHRAIVVLEIATAIRENQSVRYKLACAHARSGDSRAALESLERAVELGFSNRAQIESDPDLVSLHDMKEFRQLLATIAEPKYPIP